MSAAAPAAPADPSDEAPAPKDMARLLVIAVIVGVVGAIGATAFLYVVHELQHVAFSSLPEALGIDGGYGGCHRHRHGGAGQGKLGV